MNNDNFKLTPGEAVACPNCDTPVIWKICQRCRRPGIVLRCECALPESWQEWRLEYLAEGDATLVVGWHCVSCRRMLA